MFDIGWAELTIIGVVALIVIGPKDLPDMFRTLGRFTAKLRSMSRDFQRAMESAAKESGVQDVARDLKTATSAKSMGLDAVKDAASRFEKWDPLKPKTATMPKTPTPVASVVGAMTGTETIAAPAAVAPAVASPVVAPAPEPARALGPQTQALADKAAARRAITKDAADKLRALSDAPATAASDPAVPARKPGRVRTKPATVADATPAPAAKPKPKTKPKDTGTP